MKRIAEFFRKLWAKFFPAKREEVVVLPAPEARAWNGAPYPRPAGTKIRRAAASGQCGMSRPGKLFLEGVDKK